MTPFFGRHALVYNRFKLQRLRTCETRVCISVIEHFARERRLKVDGQADRLAQHLAQHRPYTKIGKFRPRKRRSPRIQTKIKKNATNKSIKAFSQTARTAGLRTISLNSSRLARLQTIRRLTK